LEGDYFDDQTDYMVDLPGKSLAWFSHALYPQKQRLSGDADLNQRKTDDGFGIWAETVLDERDQYERFLLDLAEKGKLGWSSGVPGHLVEREKKDDAYHITRWPLGLDASLTHIPAEARNTVIPLKSLSDILPPFPAQEEEPQADSDGGATERDQKGETTHSERIEEGTTMTEEIKSVTMTQDELDALVGSAVERGAAEAIKNLPAPDPPKARVEVEVVKDEADHPFKSMAEQCLSVKRAAMSYGSGIDPRLRRLVYKGSSTGAGTDVPSEGGFMLEPDLGGELLRPMHEEGPFTRAWNRLPTTQSHGWFWGVDETSRATGSRWGGIRGYRLAEGATLTASQPKFKRITWELKKYAVLVYATDELLEDAPQFSEIVQQGAGEELMFMANDDVLNGLGTAGPLGILESDGKVEISAETGQAAATILVENLSKMWARLLSRAKPNSVWYINTDCNTQLDELALAVGTGGLEPRFVTYDAAGIMRIKGRPVVETEFNATLGTAGDIVLADMGYYLGWMREIQSASSIHVQFLTDEMVFRFILRIDGRPVHNQPLTPYKGTNTQAPFITLATRS